MQEDITKLTNNISYKNFKVLTSVGCGILGLLTIILYGGNYTFSEIFIESKPVLSEEDNISLPSQTREEQSIFKKVYDVVQNTQNVAFKQQNLSTDFKGILCQDKSHVLPASSVLEVNPTEIPGVFFLGCLNVMYNFSLYSFAWNNHLTGPDYYFYAPLTALAWRRIGFRSIVIVSIIMRGDHWKTQPIFRHVVNSLLQQKAFILFLDTDANSVITVSQSSRFTAPGILHHLAKPRWSLSNVYMVTSDADIWPLSRWWFLLPPGKKILSTNPRCCGNVTLKSVGKKFPMLPMTSIGMSVATWVQVLSPGNWKMFPRPPLNAPQIIDRLAGVIGKRMRKFTNKTVGNWFADQALVSLLIGQWMETYGYDGMFYMPYHIKRHQRNHKLPESIHNYTDAHLTLLPYQRATWSKKLVPLMQLMYGNSSRAMLWCQRYFNLFEQYYNVSIHLDEYN